MKFLKWFLITILGLFLAVVVYVTVIFDPNDFKPQIVDLVKQETGRELKIGSDLSWTFFPSLGIELGDISLSNPSGFENASMIAVNQVVAEVALMPLFKKEVEISQLNLDGLTLTLETQKDGRNSFDGLGDKQSANNQTSSPVEDSGSSNATLAKLDIGGIAITNTKITNIDHQSATEQVFALKELTLGRFQLGQFAALKYEFSAVLPDMELMSQGQGQIKIAQDLNTVTINEFVVKNQLKGASLPNGQLQADLNTSVVVALDKQTMNLVLSSFRAANINASGSLDVAYGKKVPNIVAKLEVGDVDLDALLPADTQKATDKPQQTQSSANAVEPDLTAMKSVNLDVDVRVKSVKVANLRTQNWVMQLVMQGGVANMKQLSADLYGGKIAASAKIDGRNKVAQYQFDKRLSGVDIRALLIDMAEVDMLDGTANFKVAGKGKSLLPDNLKKNLVANGQFEIADGAIHGVNIPQMIRQAKAKLSGDMSSGAGATVQKTDFTSMTGSFNIAKGVVSNPDLDMSSPLIRLKGKGTANIINQALDYKLTTSVVGSLEGQGGDQRDALYGVEIPFAIKGTMTEPKFSLDTKALLDSKLKEETNKLKDSLFKKFGGL
ncbi:AsmA family protein [Shewanella fidelis]|uniref:AsmA family protein n=1 Tax=Shewanella fidelis TaxID=173509 RepID=A0AAW8NLH6_9GAMM|nr:AsmA family protein [Shewanella fidelis]MDR8524072.1 AsmA family protein [Shewanella fidelis]MDW4810619.1 AsmA family protein [Shewanella fidelis]MDW4814740.1 AsmA family protein [Shewanella fidelis]MDW4818830.1 AsmA family protein [Shewanella fidelis]MDW4823493.1 AsmA family protein [Shewanella fidelis]